MRQSSTGSGMFLKYPRLRAGRFCFTTAALQRRRGGDCTEEPRLLLATAAVRGTAFGGISSLFLRIRNGALD